jgi:hypothetical protein
MSNDQHFIAEAYTRIYHESDADFSGDELRAGALDHEDVEKAKHDVHDKSWIEKYVPFGLQSKAYVGVDENNREFVVWETFEKLEVTYYQYLVYKDEGKIHDIDEDQYDHFASLAFAQR